MPEGGTTSTDGQLPRALTTLPMTNSDTFRHSRGVDRVMLDDNARESEVSTGAGWDAIKPTAPPSPASVAGIAATAEGAD